MSSDDTREDKSSRDGDGDLLGVSALKARIRDQEETIAQLRAEAGSLREELKAQQAHHMHMVDRLQEENRRTFLEREAYYSEKMDRLAERQRQGEEGRLSTLLQRLELSQEFLGKGLIREVRESFLPLNVYAQRLLLQEQLRSLVEEEESLRHVAVEAVEQQEREGSLFTLLGHEIVARVRLANARTDFFAGPLTREEQLHRCGHLEVDERNAFEVLVAQFYEQLAAVSPPKTFNARPLRQQNQQEELWEIAPDVARAAAAAAAAQPQEQQQQQQQQPVAAEAIPDEERQNDQVYIQDVDKKEQTFVSGGVLFHLRTRQQQQQQQQQLSRPVMLSHFEIVFDEPLRLPREIQDADPRTLEDNLFNVRVELWCKVGSFLVSDKEKHAHVEARMRHMLPQQHQARRAVWRTRADGRWTQREREGEGEEEWEEDREEREYVRQAAIVARQFENDEKTRNEDKILSLPSPDRDSADPTSSTSASASAAEAAAVVEQDEHWVRLHSTTEARIMKNTTFVLPAHHFILQPNTEYSFFIRVVNKKILNFTKRVRKKVIPSPDGDVANATYTFDEETDKSRFFYSPIAYRKFDEALEMTGCRWNSRTASHFYKLAPLNDDVYFGRIVYHVL